MPHGRHLNRNRWLGGLVLVLALLGHDVLMASVAHAEPEATVAAMAAMVADHDVEHQAPAHQGSPPDDIPASEHPSDCGTAGIAIAASGTQLGFSDFGISALVFEADLSASTPAPAHGWSESSWPPGTRRALLQVYRI